MFDCTSAWGHRPEATGNLFIGIGRYRCPPRGRLLGASDMTKLAAALRRLVVEGPNLVTAVRLLLLMGCRPDEIRCLRWLRGQSGHADPRSREDPAEARSVRRGGARSACDTCRGRLMNSFFHRLFTYRSRDGREPQEDFFTEAFAGVLRSSVPLRTSFVGWLIDPHEVDYVHISTQSALDDGGRVDIWIEARNDRSRVHHVLAMENKIRAPVDETQLRRYESQLKREATANTRTLLSTA